MSRVEKSRVEKSLENERKRLEVKLVIEEGRVIVTKAALVRVDEALAALRGAK